ncbi:4-hydroxythreonine-4-phosphate dehydrogenase [Rhodoblastus acidophilus]|uniref:4-hydroxythreonine-4-phosphate dehydrogenase PdxA n=1 Tax=Rhodoblastus acidophilus TaxID=1074 RepID=UPI0022244929|nr:4-hydroxythreonine-4-phosphate dehydrogenase PdxA [Rhodoblastus acidophilus]MCW2285069.1 4-hydroxythreonine-4-phosphate dehydrogenase [Rhodoblastus acidophilus]MCW2334073.1 4-hydroxythreonine-4-phosphate dehydrogenase [Rhodoblastus acidophilus]
MSAAPLCVTQGDASGIGPDIALTLYAREAGLPPFFLLADPDCLRRRAALLGLDVAIAECAPEQAGEIFQAALPVVPLRNRARGTPGQPDPADAPATVEAIEHAVDFLREGRARAMVTNPIAKSVLYAAGFSHPGHTEFLGELAAQKFGEAARPVMMIWSRELAVVPATIHIPLSAVPIALREDDLVEIGRIVASALSRDFGVSNPRLAFCGLNPHAGEDGAMGSEDSLIVAPAVSRLAAEGFGAIGPLPADTMFHAEARQTYDVAIGMYHDQVLIPAKTLAFDTGVNVTLGLPFIRTSPDHGTAFSLAGTGRANTSSLAEAILLADRMAIARTANK